MGKATRRGLQPRASSPGRRRSVKSRLLAIPTRMSLDFSSCTAWPGVRFGGLEGFAFEGMGLGRSWGGGRGEAWVWGESCCCNAHQDQSRLQQLHGQGRAVTFRGLEGYGTVGVEGCMGLGLELLLRC